MSKVDFLNSIFNKQQSQDEFNFDSLVGPGVYNYFTPMDIQNLHNIATSLKYSANIKAKYQAFDLIMQTRGFKRFAGGTNRVVYKCLDNPRIVAKVAIDRVGMKDNPAEFINQAKLKPFVAKCFDVSPDGVLAICERVYPITTIAEFEAVADYVFEIIVYKLLGKYVVDDIGSDFFLNWGIREGVYPCLLDYPYVFELDSRKLYCNNKDAEGHVCLGEIDYDDGFNYLTCKKCGKKYKAFELSESEQSNNKLVILKGDTTMKVCLVTASGEVYEPDLESDTIKRPEPVATKKNHRVYTEKDLSSLVSVRKHDDVFEKTFEDPIEKTFEPDPNSDADIKPINHQVFVMQDGTEFVKETKCDQETAKEEKNVDHTSNEIHYDANGHFDVSSNFIKSDEEKVETPDPSVDKTLPMRDSSGRFVSKDDSEKSHESKRYNKEEQLLEEERDDFTEYKKNDQKRTNHRRAAAKNNIDEY